MVPATVSSWLKFVALCAAGVGLLGIARGPSSGFFSSQEARAASSDWVGAKSCAGCHEDQAKAWRAGPHAASRKSLGKKANRKMCLGCHASGEAPAGIALPGGVGCESCHGPGLGYSPDDVMRNPVLRAALGLVDLSTEKARDAVCRGCHRQELRLKRFETEAAWTRLPHSRKATRSATPPKNAPKPAPKSTPKPAPSPTPPKASQP